ncbi:hypothetical protein [Rhodopirellula sallentina]|nr:hypothetical protein [Rhodopirellula sallentina]
MTTAPTSDVEVVAFSDLRIDLVSGPGVTVPMRFTAEEWEQSRRVDVSAAVDDLTEGNQVTNFRFVVTSEDPRFASTGIPDSEVLIRETAIRPVIEKISAGEESSRLQITTLTVELDREVDHTEAVVHSN